MVEPSGSAEGGVTRFREIGVERMAEFVAAGYKQRHTFPHRIYHLPKAGPDGYQLATRMRGRCRLEQLWELVLFADEGLTGRFPTELFFDRDIVWHQQHFGRPGQIAAASVVLDGRNLYSMAHQSDVVQRISRRRSVKTQIEKRFKGWHHMLLNAILAFALEHRVRRIHVPTADLALEHTDRARRVQRPLFDRVYDGAVTALLPTRRKDGWWVIDVAQARRRVVVPERGVEQAGRTKTICVCHDLEGGLGHREVDPALARAADDGFRARAAGMLAIEGELGVRATYNVVGELLGGIHAEIEAGGHCTAFHSFDHVLAPRRRGVLGVAPDDLSRCRRIDNRIKGYRPVQSRITPALADEKLVLHNFEWIASSSYSLGSTVPLMRRRLARIPIAFDDFDLYQGRADYAGWEREALRRIEAADFVAFCLHDCYAPLWLPRYRRLLESLREVGQLRTLDEVAADLILESAA
jgi:peptidoglycan/xylan/chitin deacetylase (PgdA/CDA1 family)